MDRIWSCLWSQTTITSGWFQRNEVWNQTKSIHLLEFKKKLGLGPVCVFELLQYCPREFSLLSPFCQSTLKTAVWIKFIIIIAAVVITCVANDNNKRAKKMRQADDRVGLGNNTLLGVIKIVVWQLFDRKWRTELTNQFDVALKAHCCNLLLAALFALSGHTKVGFALHHDDSRPWRGRAICFSNVLDL